MLHRYESRQRNYTELCNRSSSGRHVGTRMPHSCDTFEDYWEDASVSLRSCHSLEPPSSPWPGATMSADAKINEAEENKRFTGLDSYQSRSQNRYTFDDNEYMSGSKARRSFPPPLASCSTLSIKEGGRFVLKEMDADRPQGFFRVQRGNGRLRLQLVLPDEVVDEEDEQEESFSPVEDITESKVVDADIGFAHAEHDTLDEETITCSQEDCCSTAKEEVIRSTSNDQVGRSVSFDTGRPAVQEVGCEGMECNACLNVGTDVGYSSDPRWDVSTHGGVFVHTHNFLNDFNQFSAAESSSSSIEQESLWNVDVSNPALASLSRWPPKQMCLHQSIVNMRPAFGLAMS